MATFKIRSIAVVGAGPAGLAAAKYLLAEKVFSRIVVFEQRSTVGGVWNYTPHATLDQNFSIPQTDPNGRVDDPIWIDQANGHTNGEVHQKHPIFASPMYETLETNLPHGLMQFGDFSFPKTTQLFPRHQSVLEYLKQYSKDIQDLIEFNTQVVNISLIPPSLSSAEGDKWDVTTRSVTTNKSHRELFDAVIVANGHYNTPYIPDIEGIREWNSRFPGSITHSKYFRRPDPFTGKKVVVVGNAASGIDIGSQIGNVSAGPLIVSSKSESYLTPGGPMPETINLPPIASFNAEDRTILFSNGHVESDVDNIVFCTGYFYSLPFLDESVQPPIIEDGTRAVNTYKHLLYRQHPTLALLALPQRVIPFPLSEAQSALLARLYSNRLTLPSEQEMRAWEDAVIDEQGTAGEFHVLQFPKDGEYINELHDWVMKAEPRDGLENGGKGRIPPYWGEWEWWCRPRFPEMRKAFGALGEARKDVSAMDQLGFRFSESMNKPSSTE